MAALLAVLPEGVGGAPINRLCGSGLDAVGIAARGVRSSEAELVIAGGVESMSRAPFVTHKAVAAFFPATASSMTRRSGGASSIRRCARLMASIPCPKPQKMWRSIVASHAWIRMHSPSAAKRAPPRRSAMDGWRRSEVTW